MRGPRELLPALSGPPISVAETLAGKELLVLGSTGFMGKVTVSLLLARYPAVGKLHLLVRRGRYTNGWARLDDEFLPAPPFRHFWESMGMDAWRQHARTIFDVLDGDITLPGYGVEDAHWHALKGRVAAIFNTSGVVDFTPPLDEAIDVNCRGVQHTLDVARMLGGIPVLHTSTCFVAGKFSGTVREDPPEAVPFPRFAELGGAEFSPRREIEECVALVESVRARADHAHNQSIFEESARKRAESRGEPTEGPAFHKVEAEERRRWVSEELVAQGTRRAHHWGFTNIYTYTKKLGELLMAESGLPYTIVRPAIVECAMEWPVRGWNEGINTCAPLTYLALKGQVGFPGDNQVGLDLIPVDWASAGAIMALAALLNRRHRPVYQLGTSDLHAFPMSRVIELTGMYKRNRTRVRPLGPPALTPLLKRVEPYHAGWESWSRTSSPMIRTVAGTLSRAFKGAAPVVPPLKMLGSALGALEKSAAQTERIFELFKPFIWINRYTFICAHIRELRDMLTEEDRIQLPFNPETFDYRDYWMNVQLPGLEKFVYPEIDARLAKEVRPITRFEDLVQLLDDVAHTHGQQVALQDLTPQGLVRTSFVDLRARADAAAVELLEQGIKPQDRVMLCSEGQSAWAVGYFAILKAGCTAVPVDAALGAETLVRLARASRARCILLSSKRYAAVGRILEAQLGSSDESPEARPLILELEPLVDRAAQRAHWDAPKALVPRSQRSEVASLIYTSGTTGKPKGVQLTHANFTSLVAGLAPIFPLGSRDAGLSVLPLHHTFEFACGLLMPLQKGGRVTYVQELNAEQLREGLRAGGVTAMIGVPALWQMFERRIRSEVGGRGAVATAAFDALLRLNRWTWSSLNLNLGRMFFRAAHERMGGRIRVLVSGGAALPPATQEFFQGLGFEMLQGYGLTEASPVITVHRMGRLAAPGTVGTAVPGVDLRIDSPNGEGVGEILARGPTIMRGYEDNREATEATLTPEGWLRTGDLGRLDRRGRLVVVGRAKEVIVSASGENVYPDQLEAALEGAEGVSELSVVGVPDGQGGEVVGVLWVPRAVGEGENANVVRSRAERALRDRMRSLSENERPRIIHSTTAPLPRTATRKVRRDEVVAELQQLETERATPGTGLEPADGLAQRVRLAVAEALARPLKDVTATSRLAADLAVDSLARTEILVALERLHGGPVDSETVATAETVTDLIDLMRRTGPPEATDAAGHSALAQMGNTDPPDINLPPAVRDVVKDVLAAGQRAVYQRVFRTRVVGRQRVPQNRNVIVAANHSSHLDMGLCKVALGDAGFQLQSLAARDYFFDGPIRRFYFENFTNLVPMERSGSLKQSLRKAGEVLDSGRSILIFPEGTRSPDGVLQEFKSVLGYLALHHHVDILPVWLGGTHSSMPKGAMLPRNRNLSVTFGVPLGVDQLEERTAQMGHGDAYREASRLAQKAVEALRDGTLLDLNRYDETAHKQVDQGPLLPRLFQRLEGRFDPARVDDTCTYYFSLGDAADAKWTVQVRKDGLKIVNQKTADQADCVLKTSAEIFRKIVEDQYTPTIMEFMSGEVKSNDPEALMRFQKVFKLVEG